MKKTIPFILAFLFLGLTKISNAQGEFYWWHFGANAGVNFPGGGAPLAFTNSALNTSEGSATISDKNGNLLFYTDGMKVWNKNNIQMTNGFGLMGNSSSCQSAIVVQRPGSPNLYFVFTVDAQAGPNGLRYSVVDMTLNGGLGDVTTKNVLLYSPTCEKITAVKHKNGCDIWVLSHHWGSANMYAHLVTSAGVNPVPVISNPGGQIYTGSNSIAIGYLKANPQGTRVASASAILANSLEIYNFNNATGVCSGAKVINTGFTQTYGCEWSPDGNLVYGASGTVYQFNATLATAALVQASYVNVGTGTYGALQCAPDGKMYHCGGGFLHRINSPNTIGVGCGFTSNAVSLAGKNSILGLPSFITSWVIPPKTFTGSPLCYGATTQFSISDTSGVLSASWNFGDPGSGASNLANTILPTGHAFSAPGTYSVQLILNYACKSDTLKNVFNIILTPTLAVSTTSATCSTPGSATVSAVGGAGPYSYTWTPTAQTNSVATGLGAGIYTISVKDNIGCINSATTNLGSNNAMSSTVTTTSVSCNGGSTATATMVAGGGSGNYGYLWMPGSLTGSVVTGLSAGVYSVTVTDLTTPCSSTKTLQIIQPAALTLTAISNTPTACTGNSITLTGTASGGTGAYSYTWTGGPQTGAYSVAQATGGNYTYSISVADANNCLKTNTITVSFVNTPTVTVSSSTICNGQTAALNAGGATTYTWTGGATGASYTNAAISNMNVTVTGENSGCTGTATATITVNPTPQINFTNVNVLCNGQNNGSSTANVSVGTAPYSYTWTTSPAQNTQTATNIPAGNYTVTVIDANNCVNTAGTQITQPTALTLGVNSTTTQACAGSPISANANAGGGTQPYNYAWTSGPATSNNNINETTPGSYTYTVTVTDANGCIINNNLSLTFHPQPTVTAISTTICAGQTAVLSAAGANNYVWQPGNVTGNTFTLNAQSLTNVSVVGEANGCTNSANAVITVNPLPNANITTSAKNGCVPLCLDYNSSSTSNIVSYSWFVNNAGISSNANGNYCFSIAANYSLNLMVTDNNGCSNYSNPVNITVNPAPIADFNHAPIKPVINVDGEVTFTDASHGATITNWNWYFMNTAQYTSNLQNPSFLYSEPGTYVVALVVKSDKGCTDTILRELVVGEDYGLYVPNAFTPNADGLNDVFQPKGFGITKYQLQIFDRWGERVFETKSFDKGWDGRFRSKGLEYEQTCEEGTYTWLINLTNVFGKAHELKGHVTLIK